MPGTPESALSEVEGFAKLTWVLFKKSVPFRQFSSEREPLSGHKSSLSSPRREKFPVNH